MAQIAFLTLFLGLTLGPQPIDLTVTGPVAAVELLLDGAPVARLSGPPWKGQIDFGPALVPHELVARALSPEGYEIGRVQQWVNLPRSLAEVDILLENGADGHPVAARLAWQSLTGESPSSLRITFDDKPLDLKAGHRVQLPAWDPETSHVLTAELRFPSAPSVRRDMVFGGRWGEEVSTELTAVPVRVRPGKELPPPERMEGWFHAGGWPLRVAALEDGPAEILVVRDLTLPDALEKLLVRQARPAPSMRGSGVKARSFDDRRFQMALGKEEAVRFVWPVPQTYSGSGPAAALFETSREFSALDGGLLWFLARFVPLDMDPAGQRLADAAAAAGLQALRTNRRRAVLLVLAEHAPDLSRSSPVRVRQYLNAIRVPLFVWTFGEAPRSWGDTEEVSSVGRMRQAFSRLEKELAAQRIVWVDGRHLPQSIRLSDEAASVIDIAGAETPAPGR